MKYAARLHGNHTEVAVALAVALFLAFLAQWGGGMAAITGSYLAGLFIAMTPEREKVVVDLHPLLNSFFGPLFFVSIGMESTPGIWGRRVAFFALILTIAILGKIVGSASCLLDGVHAQESIALAWE